VREIRVTVLVTGWDHWALCWHSPTSEATISTSDKRQILTIASPVPSGSSSHTRSMELADRLRDARSCRGNTALSAAVVAAIKRLPAGHSLLKPSVAPLPPHSAARTECEQQPLPYKHVLMGSRRRSQMHGIVAVDSRVSTTGMRLGATAVFSLPGGTTKDGLAMQLTYGALSAEAAVLRNYIQSLNHSAVVFADVINTPSADHMTIWLDAPTAIVVGAGDTAPWTATPRPRVHAVRRHSDYDSEGSSPHSYASDSDFSVDPDSDPPAL